MNNTLRNTLALPVMAIVGCIRAAVFFYIRVILIGVDSNSVDSAIIPFEGTGVMMSSIAIGGRIFHTLFGAKAEAQSVKAVIGWRITLMHILTISMILIDIFI